MLQVNDAGANRGDGTIAGQYGSSSEQKQKPFGRVDPFCAFAVLPLLVVAGFFFWGDIAIAGVAMIVLALIVVVVDSWANRPVEKPAPRYREDY